MCSVRRADGIYQDVKQRGKWCERQAPCRLCSARRPYRRKLVQLAKPLAHTLSGQQPISQHAQHKHAINRCSLLTRTVTTFITSAQQVFLCRAVHLMMHGAGRRYHKGMAIRMPILSSRTDVVVLMRYNSCVELLFQGGGQTPLTTDGRTCIQLGNERTAALGLHGILLTKAHQPKSFRPGLTVA